MLRQQQKDDDVVAMVMVLRKTVEVLRRKTKVFAVTMRGSLASEVSSAMTKV